MLCFFFRTTISWAGAAAVDDRCSTCTHTVTTMGDDVGCVPITLFAFSLAAHVWLLVRLDPARDTCQELIYETSAATATNGLLFVLGSCHVVCQGAYDRWLSGCSRLLLSTLSALVVILSARLTLFVHEADVLCHVSLNHSLPADDVLVDLASREMSGALSWAALVFFGAAVLLQECGRADCSASYEPVADCDQGLPVRPCPPPCPPRDCPPPCPPQPCDDSRRMIVVRVPGLRC